MQDDEEAIREIMASMLRSEGYECQTAETAAETFDILNAQRVDLIICGYIEWSEKDFKLMTTAFPDVPFIICTATRDRSMVENHLRITPLNYLLKPFDREEMIDAVRRALEHRGRNHGSGVSK